jgi:hypothetical protein
MGAGVVPTDVANVVAVVLATEAGVSLETNDEKADDDDDATVVGPDANADVGIGAGVVPIDVANVVAVVLATEATVAGTTSDADSDADTDIDAGVVPNDVVNIVADVVPNDVSNVVAPDGVSVIPSSTSIAIDAAVEAVEDDIPTGIFTTSSDDLGDSSNNLDATSSKI